MTALDGMAVMCTAWNRPYYLERTLASWAAADGISELGRFVIALGHTDRYEQNLKVIATFARHAGCPVEVMPQSQEAEESNGPHRAIGEAIDACFDDRQTRFVIAGEEDVLVSSDVLTYMRWASAEFAADLSVLAVLAHNRGGQGWDLPLPARDHDADQSAVRLRRYFNPWGWGIWRNRWLDVLEPEWDWECNSGGAMDSGYDWQIHKRILPRHKMRCAVPDASRSQNIGEQEGWASTPAIVQRAHSHSFRETREGVTYRLDT